MGKEVGEGWRSYLWLYIFCYWHNFFTVSIWHLLGEGFFFFFFGV